MALENAKAGIKTIFLSLEMAKEAVEERFIEIYANISEEDRVKAEYTYEQELKMKECKRELEHENFTIMDSDDIGQRLDMGVLETFATDYDLIFVDNLSFMTERTEKFHVAQAAVSGEVSLLVDRTKSTIVVLHHMKKDREGMAGSQKLEDDCNIRIDLYREKEETDLSCMTLNVRKNRRRNTGNVSIFFRAARYVGLTAPTTEAENWNFAFKNNN